MVRYLIRQGADLNVRDSANRPLIWIALWKGHLENIRALIEAGAEIDMSLMSHAQTPEASPVLRIALKTRKSK